MRPAWGSWLDARLRSAGRWWPGRYKPPPVPSRTSAGCLPAVRQRPEEGRDPLAPAPAVVVSATAVIVTSTVDRFDPCCRGRDDGPGRPAYRSVRINSEMRRWRFASQIYYCSPRGNYPPPLTGVRNHNPYSAPTPFPFLLLVTPLVTLLCRRRSLTLLMYN